jgi:hypothetical protein
VPRLGFRSMRPGMKLEMVRVKDGDTTRLGMYPVLTIRASCDLEV